MEPVGTSVDSEQPWNILENERPRLNLSDKLEVFECQQTSGIIKGPTAPQDSKGLAWRTCRNEIDLAVPCLAYKPSTSEFERILNEGSTIRKVADNCLDEVGHYL